ncbi:MAG: ATP-binding cassette domain-containing protein [Rhizomicrobium sp.]
MDFHVAAGEIVVLIGPNGSGKTTLLKALELVPAKGEIVRKPGLRVGYVPQNFARDRSLPITAGRFARLFADRAAVEAAFERVGIATLGDHQLASLSGGELARVMLARAIAAKPELFDPRRATCGRRCGR